MKGGYVEVQNSKRQPLLRSFLRPKGDVTKGNQLRFESDELDDYPSGITPVG